MISSSCLKHPNLHQLPGVCSSCLQERLHRLVDSPDIATPTVVAAANPSRLRLLYLKSPSCSGASFRCDSLIFGGPLSPPGGSRRRGKGRHRRNGSATAADGGSSVGGSLRKSRSITNVTERSSDEEEEEKRGKRSGFWSKLIRLRSGRSKEKDISWSGGSGGVGHHHHHRTLGDIFMY